ncbi:MULTISPECIES: prepilin-type N-terminal cleavage/methylation domain-containing protein [unclassified Exiguobacterium]|uniref:prepilin-type N-terminal cleavage/methylation domain-containing protein n=1 Tax=unclassified Exiguobacterium TaxID=2644629 RepID=UPI0010403642|nr:MULTISPECIES: prepilin-type N-terminal cleavage/methylation domain-containing protein [unclassified Exiguobacterium]TCI45911.1 prepilin-type N-terminal cleavage/methylation domain-containing protein [Exiguobacterium sp. SH5S32]TCI51668.1 prepilin-type N-terminal cleavage/methylation domain-containing protein [Exiguobacterium sp. SH1S4]TCI71654.1 prepilin-type N-terminal cleavage/methylation domain-containing protein [Exiguobacterium sp. SH1S1]
MLEKMKMIWQDAKQLKDERGLTLVELLVVVVILGIIAAIAVVAIGGIIENSKKDAMVADAKQMVSAAKLHTASEPKSGELVFLSTAASATSPTQGAGFDYISTLKDPFSDKEYTDAKVTITEASGKFSYAVTLKGAAVSKVYYFEDTPESKINKDTLEAAANSKK